MVQKILVMIHNVKSMAQPARNRLRQSAYEAFTGGESAFSVSRRLKLRYSSVCRWFRKFRENGESAVTENHRGPAVRASAVLQAPQRERLKEMLLQPPQTFGLDSRLGWTSANVRQCIREQLGIEVCLATARRYLLLLAGRPERPGKGLRERKSPHGRPRRQAHGKNKIINNINRLD